MNNCNHCGEKLDGLLDNIHHYCEVPINQGIIAEIIKQENEDGYEFTLPSDEQIRKEINRIFKVFKEA